MAVWRVQLKDQHDDGHDVFIDAEASTTTATLIDELDDAGFRTHPHAANNVSFTSVGTLGDLGLTHGDVVTCGRLEPSPTWPGAGRHLVVVCGPDAVFTCSFRRTDR